MNSREPNTLGWLATIACAAAIMLSGVAMAQQDDVEVMTRGPVHEAFAATVSYNPEPGIVIAAEIPAMIEELPPEQRPEGDNVAWIPGYWAWDEEQNDFLWISGVWRNLPPGRQWVPGYWADTKGGHQWTSGYWEDAETTEVTYLPEPPQSLEVGPNITATSNDQSWIPGTWIWTNSRYAWRPGCWSPARENWIWVPSYYRWTNCGYNYVNGYWDYAVAGRGVLFAPVYFRGNACYRPGYFYSPSTVVCLSVFSNHLFLRPNYCHYYFGDYYATTYRNRGFYASYSYNSSRRGCDPIYSHYYWKNRNTPNWAHGRRDYYEHRRDHATARPPRTLAALNALPERQRGRGGDNAVAEPLSRFASSGGDGQGRFQSIAKQDRARILSQTKDVQQFALDRKQLETRRASATTATRLTQPGREKVGRSPLVSTVNQRSQKSVAPPQRLEQRSTTPTRVTANRSQTKAQPVPAPTRKAVANPTRQTRATTSRQSVAGPSRVLSPPSIRQSVAGPSRVAAPTPTRQAASRPSITSPSPVRRAVPPPTRQIQPQSRQIQRIQPQRTSQLQPRQIQRSQPQRITQPQSRQIQRIQPQRASQPQPRQIQRVQPQRTAQPRQIQRAQPQRATQRAVPSRSSAQPSRSSSTARPGSMSRGGSRR